MIAIDTNLLVYAHRADMPQHAGAMPALAGLIEGLHVWALPWPCVHEFLASVTSSRWKRPSTPGEAMSALRTVTTSRNVRLIGEGANHLEWLERLLAGGAVRGGMVHDARIAAICLAHGVTELWTADRDFSRFPQLKTRNPLSVSA
jgi:toxin-antitoxin system PIN domain toxin